MADLALPPHRPIVTALLAAFLIAGTGVLPVAATDVASPSAGPQTPAPTPVPTPVPTPAGSPSPSPDPTTTPGQSAAPSVVPSAAPSAAPSASPTPSDPPAWSGRFNLYRRGAWVRQYWSYTCTAASAQTMLNIILDRSNRSSIRQQQIIRYARRHDSLAVSRGSDPQGWARAVSRFGGGEYGWKRFSSRATALRYAATRMIATGKPVGLLVWRGRHAWTMTGFASSTSPALDPAARISGIYVAPPLVGTDPKPNTYIPARALDTFSRYRERDGLLAWVGYWVVVAP